MQRRAFLATPLAAFAAPPNVRLDSDGMLVLNGTRTFALGLYQLPQGPNAWRRAADAGFHFVHTALEKAPLDQAGQHGLHAWATLGSLSKANDEQRIHQLITTWKDRPEILFWETEDEPSFIWNKPREFRVSPEVIRKTYALIKSLDPARPVYLNHSPTNLVSTLARYNPGGDLIATDVYPVIPHGIRPQYALWPDGQQGDFLNATVSQVGPYADKMRQVAGPSRGVFMVLQGFAWEMLRPKDRDPKMIRYPTAAEVRFMAFQSIAHGATGLLWWGLHTTPPESGLWDSIAATARELKALAPALAAPASQVKAGIEYHDTGHSLDRGIASIVKPTSRGQLLIAVNADKNPVEATLTLGTWRQTKLFQPFEVSYWTINS